MIRNATMSSIIVRPYYIVDDECTQLSFPPKRHSIHLSMRVRYLNGMLKPARLLSLLMMLSFVGAFGPTAPCIHTAEWVASSSTFPISARILAANADVCKPVDNCVMCTEGDIENIPVCSETGRRQRFECIAFDSDGEELEEKNAEIRSCKRTQADEEFAMIRLQVFCFLIGSLAVVQVRMQKVVSASLFELRKHGVQQKPRYRRNSDMEEEEIEFSTIEQETVPLVETSSNPLEVV